MRAPAPGPTSSARTLHAFLIASTLIVSAGALVVTRSTATLAGGLAPLDLIVLLLGAALVLIVQLLRSRLPAKAPGQSVDDWWRLNLARAMPLWALLEGSALLGAVMLFATRRPAGFAILTLVALAGLLAHSPSRLAGGLTPPT